MLLVCKYPTVESLFAVGEDELGTLSDDESADNSMVGYS